MIIFIKENCLAYRSHSNNYMYNLVLKSLNIINVGKSTIINHMHIYYKIVVNLFDWTAGQHIFIGYLLVLIQNDMCIICMFTIYKWKNTWNLFAL